MKKYRKTATIEAIKLTRKTISEIYEMIYTRPNIDCPMASDRWDDYCDIVERDGMEIPTLEDGADGRAKHVADMGDWIIRGVQGEYYACKPDIFASTYKEVRS